MSKPRVATITSEGSTLCVRLAAIRFVHCGTIPGKPTLRELTVGTDAPTELKVTVSEEVAKTLIDCYSTENWE